MKFKIIHIIYVLVISGIILLISTNPSENDFENKIITKIVYVNNCELANYGLIKDLKIFSIYQMTTDCISTNNSKQYLTYKGDTTNYFLNETLKSGNYSIASIQFKYIGFLNSFFKIK